MLRAVGAKTTVRALALEGTALVGTDGRTGDLTTQPAPIEIRLLLPAHYLRKEERFGFLRKEGFSHDVSLRDSRPLTPGQEYRPVLVDANDAKVQRATAARWALGLLGSTDAYLRLNATAVPGSREVLISADGVEWRVDLASDSDAPARVRYRAIAPFYTPPAPGERQAARAMEDADWTWTFSDRRAVDGILIPHRVTISARSVTSNRTTRLEEITFARARVNPPLTAADFAKDGQ
jgi:hypothetical protein